MRATEGLTDWGWNRTEIEEPLYTMLREPSAEVFQWRVAEGSELDLELEPTGAEPVHVNVPLSGALRGSALDLDRTRGRLEVDLSRFGEGGPLQEGWAGLLRQHADAASAVVLIADARLGAAPRQVDERTTGTVDIRIEYRGHETEARLHVEVERVGEDALLVSSMGRVAFPLDGFGDVPSALSAAMGRPLGPSLGLEFQVDIRR